MKPDCLYCQVMPVDPTAKAGLCLDCANDIRERRLLLWPCGDEVVISRVNGSEAVAYDPSRLYGDGGTPRERADCLCELLNLWFKPDFVTAYDLAEKCIKQIRACGLIVRIHAQTGAASIDRPRACPYPLLVQFLEVQSEIEDILTRERASELEEKREQYRIMANRMEYPRGNQDPDGEEISGPDNRACEPVRVDVLPHP